MMESISKKTGKKFHGKFAETAVRIGIATPTEDPEVNEQEETPALSSEKKTDKPKGKPVKAVTVKKVPEKKGKK
ncbi:MAG: hypothetical protein IMZ64_11840 [Bacteroidetes bacterium]|nr:hypothetical protein [Bacteroidota bacterium]